MEGCPVVGAEWTVHRVRVSSESLASVGYDAATSTLEIEFHNGSIYRYSTVPESVFNALIHAPSKGRFFMERIKGAYVSRRLR